MMQLNNKTFGSRVVVLLLLLLCKYGYKCLKLLKTAYYTAYTPLIRCVEWIQAVYPSQGLWVALSLYLSLILTRSLSAQLAMLD